MASSTGDNYNNLEGPKRVPASSNPNGSAESLPDSRQPTATNVLELPPNVGRSSGSLPHGAAALHSRLSYEAPNFGPVQEYLTGTSNSNIHESGSNIIGSLIKGREVSFFSSMIESSRSLGQQNHIDFVPILDI